jgi:hypothetical protein
VLESQVRDLKQKLSDAQEPIPDSGMDEDEEAAEQEDSGVNFDPAYEPGTKTDETEDLSAPMSELKINNKAVQGGHEGY